MRRAKTAVGIVFYGGLLLLMALIFTQTLDDVLPAGLAERVGFNSEGYTLALVVAAWLQFARPRLVGTPRGWPVTVAVALGLTAVGIALLASDLPSRFRTLNEAALAAAFAVLYLGLRRPLPTWVPVATSGAVLALIVFFSQTALVTGLSEMLGVLIVLPLAVDVFDRRILDPAAPASRRMQYGFYAAIAIVPTTLMVLERTVDVGGVFGAVTRYGVRMHEAFVGVLLVVVYLAVRRALEARRPRPVEQPAAVLQPQSA